MSGNAGIAPGYRRKVDRDSDTPNPLIPEMGYERDGSTLWTARGAWRSAAGGGGRRHDPRPRQGGKRHQHSGARGGVAIVRLCATRTAGRESHLVSVQLPRTDGAE